MIGHVYSLNVIDQCRVCNSADLAPLYNSARQQVNVWKCKRCKSKIVANDFSEEESQNVYESAGEYYNQEASDHETLLRQKARDIARFIHNKESRKTLLDVGAGIGTFLNAARDEGFEVHGLEFADLPIKIAHQKYGIVLAKRTLEDETSSYDIVTALSVLEHVHRPYAFVREAARVLQPGGILVIYAPAYGAFDRLAWYLYRLSGSKLTHLLDWRNTRAHLSILTEKALRWLVRAHGLGIVLVRRLCEYNQPIANYFRHVGIRSPSLLNACSTSMRWLVSRNLFFRNNILIYARKAL